MDGIKPVFDDIQCSSGALMAIQQCSYSTSIGSLCTDSTDVSVNCCKRDREREGEEGGRGRERNEEETEKGERSLKEEIKKEETYNHHNYYLLQHQQDWMITHIQG